MKTGVPASAVTRVWVLKVRGLRMVTGYCGRHGLDPIASLQDDGVAWVWGFFSSGSVEGDWGFFIPRAWIPHVRSG